MFNLKRKYSLFLCTGLFIISAMAFECKLANAQTLSVTENATIKANISVNEPTRIAVENDRIAILRGAEGAYTYSNDNNSGAVFLKPTQAYQNKPFYVFVSTEQNHNYILQLTPTSKLSASMLILKSHDQAIKVAEQWEIGLPYTDLLAELMKDMVNHTSPEGYAVIPVNAKKATSIGRQLQMRLITIYSGAHLQGQIYEVTNQSKTPIFVVERLFYRASDCAIALQDETISAGGKTLLYKVIRHG